VGGNEKLLIFDMALCIGLFLEFFSSLLYFPYIDNPKNHEAKKKNIVLNPFNLMHFIFKIVWFQFIIDQNLIYFIQKRVTIRNSHCWFILLLYLYINKICLNIKLIFICLSSCPLKVKWLVNSNLFNTTTGMYEMLIYKEN